MAAHGHATSLLEGQLSRIEELAEKKAGEMDADAFHRYYPVYEIAIHFLRRKPVLLYGGTAINELLPKRLKFYPAQQLPDMDVFALDPVSMAKALVAEYHRKGVSTAVFKPALHPDTWKVFAEGLQVADITGITPAGYRRLREGSVVGPLGVRIANPRFLCLTMHQMLSQPMDAHRWTKTYKRLAAFYHVFPPAKCFPRMERAPAPTEILPHVLTWLKSRPHVLVGAQAYLLLAMHAHLIADTYKPARGESTGFLGTPGLMPKRGTLLDVLVDEAPAAVAKELVAALVAQGMDAATLRVSRRYKADDFVAEHVLVLLRGRPVVGIYTAPSCMSYIETKGLRVATIHTLLRTYLSWTFSSHRHLHLEDNECISNMLGWVLLSHVPSRKKLLQPFVLECYGDQAGLITMRREHFQQ